MQDGVLEGGQCWVLGFGFRVSGVGYSAGTRLPRSIAVVIISAPEGLPTKGVTIISMLC